MTATEGAPRARPGLAWTVLGVGVIAYVLTVMQRTSLGVARGVAPRPLRDLLPPPTRAIAARARLAG